MNQSTNSFNGSLHNKALNYPPHVKPRYILTLKKSNPPTKIGFQQFKMYVTVETRCVTELRCLVINTFKNIVSSITIQPIEHANKMKVCFCFSGKVEETIMNCIMRTLPSAEFGRISIAK